MSRWGPKVPDEVADALLATSDITVTLATEIASTDAGTTTIPNTKTTANATTLPNTVPADADFDVLTGVEWGLGKHEDGYDTDQSLAPRPRPQRVEPCSCELSIDFLESEQARKEHATASSSTTLYTPRRGLCLDDSCLLRRCQEECPKTCPGDMFCGNRRITNGEFRTVRVVEAGRKGRGLVVEEDVDVGDMILEYVGRAVPQKQLAKYFRRYQHDRRLYIMSLGDGIYIDARSKGGLARYINHSCEPNCQVQRWKVKGVLRAVVVPTRSLSAGTELTFDYQWERQRGRAATKCYCGTPSCRGTLEVIPKHATAAGPGTTNGEELPIATSSMMEPDGEWKSGTLNDQTLVNRVVQVYDRGLQKFQRAEVTGYDPSNQTHQILLLHDLSEVWVDLSKTDWMVLEEPTLQDQFMIAKKVAHPSTTSASATAAPASSSLLGPTQSPVPIKNYIYVQTPVKEGLWAKHLVERCERNCQVQINAHQVARPPLPPSSPEELEMFAALDRSHDGTVWKVSITGSNVYRAYGILEKNVAYVTSSLEHQQQQNTSASVSPTPMSGGTLTSVATDEMIYPRRVADLVKRKLVGVRERCKSVTISFAPSDSKSKSFSRIVVEGSLPSDLAVARDVVWKMLLDCCREANLPVTIQKMPRDLGILGGVLTPHQFELLSQGWSASADSSKAAALPKDRLRQESHEDLSRSSFFRSFQATYPCNIWTQSEEDMGRIGMSNLTDTQGNGGRSLYLACEPSEVSTRWAQILSRATELERGVNYLYLGSNRIYQPLMLKNNGQFFEFVKGITGASVSIDPMTGDHLRIDGSNGTLIATLSDLVQSFSDKQRANLAEEIIRLQIELYRDNFVRNQNWIFGRDWTLASLSASTADVYAAAGDVGTLTKSSSLFGYLDSKSAAYCGTEIAEIVATVGLNEAVAAHAMIILYRFVTVGEGTHLKAREALLASVFLANKCQKAVKWKKLESILEAGYSSFYPGTKFDRIKEEVLVLEERVIAAERDILDALQFDIFVPSTEWLVEAVAAVPSIDRRLARRIMSFTYCGQVLSAGTDLWLKYGVEYLFAAAAAFMKVPLGDLLPVLGLIPLKVLQAAELLVESIKLGRPSGEKTPSHPLLEGRKDQLEQYLPEIKKSCVEAMTVFATNRRPGPGSIGSANIQRYRIISKRSRCRYKLSSIPTQFIAEAILPSVDGIAATSTCSIFIETGATPGTEDIVMEGHWRAVSLAEHLVRESVKTVGELPSSIDASADLKDASQLQAKADPGLLQACEIQTSQGWEGTIQPDDSKTSGHRVGGKCCVAGKITKAALRSSGLRWWIPPSHGTSLSGSICDLMAIRSSGEDNLTTLGRLASSFVGPSGAFPLLTKGSAGEGNEDFVSVAVSLQRWPSEKVTAKEEEKAKKYKGKAMKAGFSASALQEMQLLTNLHSLVPSSHGHPNFILPIAIALPSDHSPKSPIDNPLQNASLEPSPLDDAMFSLFRSTEENDRTAKKDKKVKGFPHLVFHPTPFVLQRFFSRKYKSSEEQFISPAILAVWFHDLISAYVHCHSNYFVIRTVQADQIIVDQSGVAKLGGLYRGTVIPVNERHKSPNLVEAARSKKKDDRKKDDEDVSANPYAAPEILLGSPKFTMESDIWALGCLLAQLLLSKPLFVGKDRVSLLTAQYKIVGTPSKKNFLEAAKFPYYFKPAKMYKRGVDRALGHMLKNQGETHTKAINLIASMLHLDPSQRCTAAEALGHEWMIDFIEQSTTQIFRQRYVEDWVNLKARILQMGTNGRTSDLARDSKRQQAMITAATWEGEGDEDDLYDMDDLLAGNGSAKKQKNDSELQCFLA
jgi:serine/threonine protein kinase